MIILGIILLVAGFLFKMHILWVIGVILLIVAATTTNRPGVTHRSARQRNVAARG
jgi:hypothetical protein